MIHQAVRAGLLGCSLIAVAACGGGAEPEPEASLDVTVHDGDFARIQAFTTPGGVSVWLVNEPSIPIVSFQVAWPGGSSNDPAGLEGLSGALTYLMREGAGELESLDFARAMEDQAMSFGCSNSRTWTSCSASMLSEATEDSMALVALALSEPRFDSAPFERFVRQQEVSLSRRETDARFLGSEAMETALYPDHPFALELSAESLAALTTEEIAAHKDRLMVREGMIVTVVGDITAEEFAPLIDGALGGLPEAGSVSTPEPVALGAPIVEPIQVDLPQPQSRISFMAPGVARGHPDHIPAIVLNYTLGGGGFESRLMQELRVERGLTYGIGTFNNTDPLFATWSGAGQTKNESAGEFITVLKSMLQDIADNGITETELDDAKAYITGSYPLAFDSNGKIAGNLMAVRQLDLGMDYFDLYTSKVDAVSLDDVQRVAATYLAPENFTFVVVGQPEGL